MFDMEFSKGELSKNNIAKMANGTVEIFYKGLTIKTDEFIGLDKDEIIEKLEG